jgi:hypothetical protein
VWPSASAAPSGKEQSRCALQCSRHSVAFSQRTVYSHFFDASAAGRCRGELTSSSLHYLHPTATIPPTMKILPTAVTNPGQNIQGVQYRVVNWSIITGQTLVAQGIPSNRLSRSPFYRGADNAARHWDSVYHQLPIPGPPLSDTQQAWDILNATLSGWTLCGCVADVTTGQTLFRNTNINRQILDLNPLLGPTVLTPPDTGTVIEMLRNVPDNVYTVFTDPTANPIVILFRVGLGLQNPWIEYPSGVISHNYPLNDPDFAAAFAALGVDPATLPIGSSFQMPYCTMSPEGYPGQSSSVNFVFL